MRSLSRGADAPPDAELRCVASRSIRPMRKHPGTPPRFPIPMIAANRMPATGDNAGAAHEFRQRGIGTDRDADLLYQPRRQDPAEDAAHAARARQGGIEAPVREGVKGLSRRPGERRDYAALIFPMKRSSSSRRRVLSADSERAEWSTSSDAEPVSVAPLWIDGTGFKWSSKETAKQAA
jgi:hypothetical protein